MFFNVYVDKLMRSKQTCQTNIEGKSGEIMCVLQLIYYFSNFLFFLSLLF